MENQQYIDEFNQGYKDGESYYRFKQINAKDELIYLLSEAYRKGFEAAGGYGADE